MGLVRHSDARLSAGSAAHSLAVVAFVGGPSVLNLCAASSCIVARGALVPSMPHSPRQCSVAWLQPSLSALLHDHCLLPHGLLGSCLACRGCVAADTVAWVRQQAAALPRVPSLAFIHIPLPQHFLAWNHGAVNGSKGELVGCPGMDSGFFELAK